MTKEREGGREDFLLLPIPAGTVLKEYEEIKHSRPTLLLPTQDNVARLLDFVESFPDLSTRTLEQIEWMDKMLDNNKGQFTLRSHLNVKAEATAENDQGDSYLRRSLSQEKPPERIIQGSDCAWDTDQGLECCVSTALEDNDSCSDHSSEELD
ncbi:Zinc finger BED domain-containing protein RICESLEEPER 2 [Fusarium oxysporum f. sp. albedinis]|nr:Zinc finger BED domain-containing protein RICESLEEPER 2 [Fusarium oxysporum f. sp. albedinis]